MFDELLIEYSKYFRIGQSFDENTMSPVLKFESKMSSDVLQFNIPIQDVKSFNSGIFVKSIDKMKLELKTLLREIKINIIIK